MSGILIRVSGMPSGKVHATASSGAAIGIAIGGIFLPPIGDTIVVAAGALSGIVLSPDLDHDQTIIGHRYMRKIFGGVVGKWWYYLWHSYSISFKHRSFWSHGPVIGTLVRLTYLLFPPIIVPFHNQKYSLPKRLIYLLISTVAAIPIIAAAVLLSYYSLIDINIVVLWVIGLMISDVLHWLFDTAL